MDYKVNKEAVDKIIERVLDNGSTVINKNVLEEIFPELKESEDERISKALIEHFKWNVQQILYDFDNKEVLAWLERQGEIIKEWSELKFNYIQKELQEMVDLKQKTEQGEQKPAWSEEDELHIRELESLVKRVWAIAEHENDKDTIHEMSDLSFFLKTLKPQLKQEWSEEDKNYYDTIIAILENTKDDAQLSDSQISFLKSLRPQLKQEWSDFDKDILFRTIDSLKFLKDTISKDPKYAVNIIDIEREISWLKSLRPQSQWKPSEEMLEALYRAIPENVMAISKDEMLLDKLYQGLKYGRVLSKN